jgi:hypothetical protein
MYVTMGIDVGQKRDPTAVCIAQSEWREVEGRMEIHFTIRHLERLPIGTPYPEVIERVGRLAFRAGDIAGEWPFLYVDATGVGQPIVDALRDGGYHESVAAVVFTAGETRKETWDGERLRVSLGKEFLVSRLQTLLGTGRLHLPPGPEMEALADELLNYELRVDAKGHAKAGAFRVGTHDDLVTAVGLATQVDDVDWPAPPWVSAG